jgi:hemerythrin-like domain-containing protein
LPGYGRAMPDGADLRLYYLVHKAFRETGREIAECLAGLDPSDTQRVSGVADVWEFYSRQLRHHHVNEDDVIWPTLVRRRAAYVEIEREMEKEHEEMDAVLDPADAAVSAMRRSPSTETVKTAADAVAAFDRVLIAHLDHEEQIALPAVHEALGRKEFDKMGEDFLKSIPKDDLPYAAASLDEWAHEVPDRDRPPPPPLPVRLLVALSWRRKYRKFVAPIRAAG